jgi:hypothetical protein
MAIPRSRSYLGIAKETRPTPGSAPTAVAATDFIPFTNLSPIDSVKYLDDKGIRGSMTSEYDVIQGNIHSEIEFGGDVFPDSIGYMLSGVLGDVTTTGASAPYTHTFALLNSQATNGQPVTFTLSDYYGLGSSSTRQYAGCQFQSLDIKFTADALMTYTAKALGYKSATATNPTLSVPFPTVTPLPSWIGTVTLNSSTNATMAEGNVNIQRAVDPIFTVDGNQSPYQLFAGDLTVSGAMTLVFESDTELAFYLNNTRPPLVINFQQGTAGALTQVQFTLTKCAFTQAAIKREKEYVELSVNYKGLANTTDVGTSAGYSPIKVQIKNAKTSGTYA